MRLHLGLFRLSTFCVIGLILLSFVSDQKAKKPFILVLDAGHGGEDAGARGYGGTKEKDITLDVTLQLGNLIERNHPDVKIIYTRRTDVFIPLHTRADIANRSKADLFISIHCNSASRTAAKGTETFVLGMHRNDENFEISKRENSVILLEDKFSEKYQGYSPNSPTSVIGFTLGHSAHLENSIQLAKMVEDQFVASGRETRGVKQAGFLVIRRTVMPSVLIETGFISNPEEGLLLGSSSGKAKTAQSIFKAFEKYKNYIDQKNGAKGYSTYSEPRVPKRLTRTRGQRPIALARPKEGESPVGGVVYKVEFLKSKHIYPQGSPQLKGLWPVLKIRDGKDFRYYYGNTSYLSTKEYNEAEVKKKFNKAKTVEFKTLDNAYPRYSVQVMASYNKVSLTNFTKKGLKNIRRVKKKGVYRYYYGDTGHVKKAENLLQEVIASGFSDAFLVLSP